MLDKKKAIVTGGAGFIGSHMVDLLVENGFFVTVIDNLSGGRESNLSQHKDNKNVEFIETDICKIKYNDKNFSDTDFVFHFAGKGDIVPSIENPDEYMNTNVNGTLQVLQASKEAKIKKFVYAASSSCYGLAETPTKEDNAIDTKYPYALSKYIGELVVLHWGKVYNLPVNSIRIFNAYGTRVKTTGVYGAVFGVFFKQKLSKKPFTIVGDGEQKRDFVYVTDVARAFYLAATTEKNNQIYNLGAGNPQSINKLIEIIGGDKIHLPKRPGEPEITHADINKITNELGWSPLINFEDGVEKMIAEISNWEEAPLWDKDTIEEATKIWFKYMRD